jgi:type 1 glutamine amidotransferase
MTTRTTAAWWGVTTTAVAAGVLALMPALRAQGGRDASAAAVFGAIDTSKDGTITREEWRATFDGWYGRWAGGATSLTGDALVDGLSQALPDTGPQCGGRSPNPRTPCPNDVSAMVAALPATSPATPARPRKVLVLARTAGYVHSSIPLAARTVEELGKKTGAWTTTISYDAADINPKNLAQYDAIFLASTTGHFLDDEKDPAATAARRAAFLAFVRGGKGLAAIHAATDSYHRSRKANDSADPARLARLGPGIMLAFPLANRLVAQADANGDKALARDEYDKGTTAWFDAVDPQKTGRVTRAEFVQRYAAIMPPPPPRQTRGNGQAPAAAGDRGPDDQIGTWPEFNTLLGGFFKFHWNDGQAITYKIDDPGSPLTAPFAGKAPFVVADETYTFGREVYSRKNLRVLTSVDMAAMSDEDKAKEQFPRPDGDHPLSWIRAEQKGRVFYMSHGHNEKVYANPVLLQHLLAGIQYAIGDLKADDRPSVR